MFRILVVDDDPAGTYLLKELMQNVHHAYELYFVSDGMEALDFLYSRGEFSAARRPNLILLDMNMPRMGGLETLSAIKSDPELCPIPVIMLSTASDPQEVRRSYQAHAACYVEKPSNLARSVKLVKAIEAFWMEFAARYSGEDDCQLADCKGKNSTMYSDASDSGPGIASDSAEVRGRVRMSITDSPVRNIQRPSGMPGCAEHDRLLDDFGIAVRELLALHEQQFRAISAGEGEFERFDILIHMANEEKQLAKYAYLRHVEDHGCSKL
jgi:chemotaxis family two-component system response regulator Rcp1